ncbi:MAG TPA: hypothetical protein VF009_05585 [Solirubrobacterales bacterium]
MGKVLSHNGWSHNDYQSPVLKYANKLGLGGVDSQYVHETDGHCYRDDTQRATGNPIGNRYHVRLFSTARNGTLWVVGDAHHDQVESRFAGCKQAFVGGHITSSFNSGREAIKNAWPSTAQFVTWGNTYEITQCNGEKKHSDGKVLFLNSNIAGIAGYDPENTEEPTVSGTPQIGNTLTVHPGTWTGNPTSFVYEWCQVEPSTDSCEPYSGATGSTWTATSGSLGKIVGVMVRPTGSDEADAVISEVVQISAPPPSPPTVTTLAASNLARFNATLNGTVNPNGQDTHYYFEYGITTAYGQAAPAVPGVDIGSGTNSSVTPTEISGLLPETTYHYRLVVENCYGSRRGEDQVFVTNPLLSRPSAYVYSDGSQMIYFRGTDGAIWQWMFEIGTQQWHLTRLGGVATGDPAAQVNGSTQEVYFRGTDGAIWQWQWATYDRLWHLTRLGGEAAGSPDAYVYPDGSEMIYFASENEQLAQLMFEAPTQQWHLTPLGGSVG